MSPADHLRILVVGPGALGLVAATRLADDGHTVLLAARTAARAATLNEKPLRVDIAGGETERACVPAVSSVGEVVEPIDLMIIATKCSAALQVTESWKGVLKDSGTCVSFQNGFLGDQMADILGDRLVECAVYYPATLKAPGHSQLTGKGHLHLGPWPTGVIGPGTRTQLAAESLASIVPVYTYQDMFSVKWNKLAVNAAMTSLGVVSGLGMAGMMHHSVIRDAFLKLVTESLQVAIGAGATPMALGGFNAELITKLPRLVSGLGLRLATRKHGLYKSSSQQSLERDEPTEVDYLNGWIVSEASRLGIPSPWNSAIVDAVHAIETQPEKAGVPRVVALRKDVKRRG